MHAAILALIAGVVAANAIPLNDARLIANAGPMAGNEMRAVETLILALPITPDAPTWKRVVPVEVDAQEEGAPGWKREADAPGRDDPPPWKRGEPSADPPPWKRAGPTNSDGAPTWRRAEPVAGTPTWKRMEAGTGAPGWKRAEAATGAPGW